jgi:hypothetical protein
VAAGPSTPQKGISHHVIIEAGSPSHADDRAESIGLYFHGVNDGRDCECCGDRWHAKARFGDGEDLPSVYGDVVSDAEVCPDPSAKWMGNDPEGYIHYLDGTVKKFW